LYLSLRLADRAAVLVTAPSTTEDPPRPAGLLRRKQFNERAPLEQWHQRYAERQG
jgi:hypothetical protein